MSKIDQEYESGNAFVVFGVGFGDEGKGTIVDALARRTNAKTVVRYNGGPQAGHNVIESDGTWHCFAQFGAGTLAGARTHISHYMLVELEALMAEAEALQTNGIHDPFSLLTMDTRCLIITPGHKLVGQLREIMRDKNRFGSCGMGVGEAIQDAEKGLAITVHDLLDPAVGPRKLRHLFETKQNEANRLPGVHTHAPARERMEYFRQRMSSPLYETYVRILERLESRLDQDGERLDKAITTTNTCIFEGAQGALLTRVGGFAPYVTQSRATWHHAQDLLAKKKQTTKIGVFRAYGHRHGNGPFVTEDARLLHAFDDPRNLTNRWQGAFRVGHLDLVALRYGLKLNDGADMLALTHLDRLSSMEKICICTSYEYPGDEQDLGDYFRWEHQDGHVIITEIMTQSKPTQGSPSVADILFRCRPHGWQLFDGWDVLKKNATKWHDLPLTAKNFIRWLESPNGLDTPIGIVSIGPRSDQKLFLLDK